MWRGSSFQLWMIEHGGKKLRSQCICWQKVTSQLFVKEKGMNLSLIEAKGALLEDVSEFVPQHYWFLKPISGNSKIPLAAKQEKLVTLRKCLVESKREFFLYLQSCEEKPSGNIDGKSCSKERVLRAQKQNAQIKKSMSQYQEREQNRQPLFPHSRFAQNALRSH